jgi:hypothetical protein
VRREIFRALRGFDESKRALEDIEFGYRLHRAGYRIRLVKDLQFTHLKTYTLTSLVRSDVLNRAIPWTQLMLQHRIFRNDLNTKSNHVASVVVSFLILCAFWQDNIRSRACTFRSSRLTRARLPCLHSAALRRTRLCCPIVFNPARWRVTSRRGCRWRRTLFIPPQRLNKIRALTTRRAFDVAQIEHSFLLPYRHALASHLRGKTILDLHNIGARQYRRMLDLTLSPRERAQFWLKARMMRD